jgi:hypothetical protein
VVEVGLVSGHRLHGLRKKSMLPDFGSRSDCPLR